MTVALRRCTALACLACLALLAGCGKPNTYELVMELRPASVTHYFAQTRKTYDDCVAEARRQNLPVKPFTVASANYVISRTTTIGDGKSIYKKATGFRIELTGITPENACGTDIVTVDDISTVHDGVAYASNKLDRGVPQTEPEQVEPPRMEEFALYTKAQTINGIALKCAGPQAAPAKQESNWCIIDPDVAIVAYADGLPLIAHQRLDFFAPNPVMAEVPVSFKVGIKIDPAIFARR